jgi:hypothetical protein
MPALRSFFHIHQITQEEGMYNTDTARFEPLTPALAAKFAGPDESLTATERKYKSFARFETGEVIVIKGMQFRVGQIGPRKLVLRPLIPQA